MSRLRIVKERRIDSVDYDQDLRGLMQDPLLTGPMVYPVLSGSSDNPSLLSVPKILSVIVEDFNCRIHRPERTPDLVHIVFHDQNLMAPKLQTLRLFHLAIVLSAILKGSDLSVSLWQAVPFEQKLRRSAAGITYDQGLNPTEFFRVEFLRQDVLLTVHAPLTHALQQAGIEGFTGGQEERVFDSRSLSATLDMMPLNFETKRRSVGG